MQWQQIKLLLMSLCIAGAWLAITDNMCYNRITFGNNKDIVLYCYDFFTKHNNDKNSNNEILYGSSLLFAQLQ